MPKYKSAVTMVADYRFKWRHSKVTSVCSGQSSL